MVDRADKVDSFDRTFCNHPLGAKQEVSLQLTLRYIYLPHVWLLNNYSDDALGTVEHIF